MVDIYNGLDAIPITINGRKSQEDKYLLCGAVIMISVFS